MTGREFVGRLNVLVEERRYLAGRALAELHAATALSELDHVEAVVVGDLLTMVATAAEAMEALGHSDPAPDHGSLALPPVPVTVR